MNVLLKYVITKPALGAIVRFNTDLSQQYFFFFAAARCPHFKGQHLLAHFPRAQVILDSPQPGTSQVKEMFPVLRCKQPTTNYQPTTNPLVALCWRQPKMETLESLALFLSFYL